MNYEAYTDIREGRDLRTFTFVSIGKKGAIPKCIFFEPTPIPYVYNFAFGNLLDNGGIDDASVSDNGDRNKILATLAKIIYQYTHKYPERKIYFRGSTEERTRLYRMAVGLNLEELSNDFEIYAEVDDSEDFVPFCKNMKINAFLIKRKIS
ncbi:MAG TPA: hypothetical protein VIM79_22915 [Niastella sp.]